MGRTAWITIVLPDHLADMLKYFADKRNMSISDVIREAIENYLAMCTSNDLAIPQCGKTN